MLGFERNSMFNAPYLVIFPGIAILITVLAFNLLGEGLRDSLDPRLSIPILQRGIRNKRNNLLEKVNFALPKDG